MKRQISKKTIDKPKSSQISAKINEKISTKTSANKARAGQNSGEMQETFAGVCRHCLHQLAVDEQAFYVEEEVGRLFCSESCISEFFKSEIKKLEKEYFKMTLNSDLNDEERQKFAHLRWLTLQEPDEIWREKTLSGDYRFTLISEFQPELTRIWFVCICLCLRGEPSFLYLAFPTKNYEMIDKYRKGKRIKVQYNSSNKNTEIQSKSEQHIGFVDGLADDWTQDESLRAQLPHTGKFRDIPIQEYRLYESCLEETLETPNEVWSMELEKQGSLRLYHFLKSYSDENPEVWYIVIARETEDDDQIEILDAFPTRDLSLVEQFRKGIQEVSANNQEQLKRMMH